eukprot:jgi/Psemu1/302863/fgenesh1_kg.83_\
MTQFVILRRSGFLAWGWIRLCSCSQRYRTYRTIRYDTIPYDTVLFRGHGRNKLSIIATVICSSGAAVPVVIHWLLQQGQASSPLNKLWKESVSHGKGGEQGYIPIVELKHM